MKTKQKPKTNSDILWHFTGGPAWDLKKNCQSKNLKPDRDAYGIALKILISKNLRLGNYHELLKVIVPSYPQFDPISNSVKIRKNHPVELKTSPVCCLAEIPESELFHHAKRYGKMGIGFKRKSILRAGFNPVFYTLHHTDIALKFFSTKRGLENQDVSDVEYEIENALEGIRLDLCNRCEDKIDLDGNDILSVAESKIWEIEDSLKDFEHIMSYVKTFDTSEFDTIYAEREWRNLTNFEFEYQDIHSIIFPSAEILQDFKKRHSKKVKLLNSVILKHFDGRD
jgi:hypothetical protein